MTVLKYFKECDFSQLSDATILLDYGGTLRGSSGTDADSDAAVRALAKRNKVYICSSSKPNEAYASSVDATWLTLDKPKPFVGQTLTALMKQATLPVIVIGDSAYIDGALAKHLDVPFIRVRSLYNNLFVSVRSYLDKFRGETYSLRPAFLRDVSSEPVTILTAAPGQHNQADPPYLTGLIAGMTGSGVKVLLNPPTHLISATVCALGNADALAFALERKKRGFIKLLVAGPEIMLHPSDNRELIGDPAIDKIILSAPWLKEWWSISDQYFNRAEVVSLGVKDVGARHPEAAMQGDCIIYASDVPENIFRSIIAAAWQHKLQIIVSEKGSFKSSQYEKLLKNARCVIYACSHDTTGLALKHAWMADVPTLCYQPEGFTYRTETVHAQGTGAPFLTDECGMSFSGALDFDSALSVFLEKLPTYTPRRYALNECTAARGAASYLHIIRSAQNA